MEHKSTDPEIEVKMKKQEKPLKCKEGRRKEAKTNIDFEKKTKFNLQQSITSCVCTLNLENNQPEEVHKNQSQMIYKLRRREFIDRQTKNKRINFMFDVNREQ